MRFHSNKLIDLALQSAAYGAGIFGRQILIYATLPLFTYRLAQSDFGLISITTSFITFINILINAGLGPTLFRFYNDAPGEQQPDGGAKEHGGAVLGTAQALFLANAVLMSALVYLLRGQIAATIFRGPAFLTIAGLVAGQVFLEGMLIYFELLLRLRVRPLASSLRAMLQISLQLGLALFFVYGLDMGVYGYFLGFLWGALAGFALMLWLLRADIGWRPSRLMIARMLRYALPLYPSMLALWALNLLDRWLLAGMQGYDQLAVYELGYRVGSIAGLALPPFISAWPQFAYSNLNSPQAGLLFKNMLTYFVAIFAVIILAIIALAGVLVDLLAPASYAAAVSVVAWVAGSQLALGLFHIFNISFHAGRRPELVTVVTVIAALANILANLLLIPRLGIQGAAIATLLAYALLALLARLLGGRFLAINANGPALLKTIVLFAAALGLLALAPLWQAAGGLSAPANLALRLALPAGYTLALLVSGVLPYRAAWEQLRLWQASR